MTNRQPRQITLDYLIRSGATEDNLPRGSWENFKKLLGGGLRSPKRKGAVQYLTLHSFRRTYPKTSHWGYGRIIFSPNGEVVYVAGQDYVYEWREVREHIFRKVLQV